MSSRKYLAFDLEIAKSVPNSAGNLLAHRPLGITCAATLVDGEKPHVWYGKQPDGQPTPQMSPNSVRQLVSYLTDAVNHGLTILIWNGLGFDFVVLADESEQLDVCRDLARSHVDMMFHVFCNLGFPVALDKVAQAMGLEGKMVGVEGKDAPILWAEGQHDTVFRYVAQDVRTTLEVAHACAAAGCMRWITREGTMHNMPLHLGWLPVNQALELPEPDTSWMDLPLPRTKFAGWLAGKF